MHNLSEDALPERALGASLRAVRIRPIDLVDVFVYLVVLGVFVQFFPEVIAESFALSLLTAVLLKVVLEVVMTVKKRIVARIRDARSVWVRVVNIASLLVLMPGSKFVVLELVDVLFGDAVYLGGFFAVTGLIIVLMLARGGVRMIWAPRESDHTSRQ